MSISLKTHKRLWARSDEECAFPGCSQPLLVPLEEDPLGGDTIVGEECHIVAKADDGPRSPAHLTENERERWDHLVTDRDGYANLVLMCGVHHTTIDGDPSYYTIERVIGIKNDHERKVRRTTPRERQIEEEAEIRYAAIVDGWAERIELDSWDGRIGRIAVSGSISAEYLARLEATTDWLLRRVWPRTIPSLDDAFLNWRYVAEDLAAIVGYYSTERHGEILIDRVHKEAFYPEEQYKFLRDRSEYHQDLATDLAVELTRAVNLVSDRVRETLWPDYRLPEGYATIGLGLDETLTFQTLRPSYPVGVEGVPYPRLRPFLTERESRDYHRGAGEPREEFGLPGD